MENNTSELKEKVVSISRVAKVVKGGRTFRFSAVVVVGDDGRHVDVPAGRMDQVVAADGRGVSVAGDDNDLQFGLCHFDAGGKGNGSSVGGVYGVEIHVSGGS